MSEHPRILSVGCGNMGGALLARFAAAAPGRDILAISQSEKKITGVRWQPVPAPLKPDYTPDIILLAVKPQVADDILPRYQKFSNSIFISIMAGKDMGYLQKILGDDKKIIRAMPNLLVKVQKGFTSYCMNKNCTAADEKTFTELFLPTGVIEKIIEDKYDMMTALFGCAPGFILYMADVMQKVAYDRAQIDISHEKLRDIIKDMIIGSMEIVGDKSFEDSYKQVASRGGMTEAGINYLQEKKFEELWAHAIGQARVRAEELSK
ncbi:MAG: pyrroline-5-carboxylate reductase dimerization domain-containing protein [Hydrotalea sp.]|nr:pyrroline-5-carboxylate reductase dimerization domain-containing protein [Hydrotalea sp.]